MIHSKINVHYWVSHKYRKAQWKKKPSKWNNRLVLMNARCLGQNWSLICSLIGKMPKLSLLVYHMVMDG